MYLLLLYFIKYLLTAEKNPKFNSGLLIRVLHLLQILLIQLHFSCSTQLSTFNTSAEHETIVVSSAL